MRIPCVLGLALLAALSGCTSRVGGAARVQTPGQSPSATLGDAPTWDAALPGEFADAGDEASRRDSSLNLQSAGPLLASNQWPHAPRPLFERTRRVHLPREPRTVLQFLPPAGSR